MFFKTQEVWKLMYHSDFHNKKNMHFIVTIHTKSRLSLAPKKSYFLCTNKSYLRRLTVPIIICYYFENHFYVRKSSKLFWSFQKIFAWFSGVRIISKITKVKKKIHLHTNVKGTSFLKKYLKIQAKLEKILNFLSDIHNLPHIHQLRLTCYGDFEVYFCSIFYFH